MRIDLRNLLMLNGALNGTESVQLWTNLIRNSDSSDFKSNGGWWRLRWFKFDDDYNDLNLMTITMIVALGMYRWEVSVGRSGGSVINPRVFCIVRSLLMWSLSPYTISNFHIFTFILSNSFLAPFDICIRVPTLTRILTKVSVQSVLKCEWKKQPLDTKTFSI